MKRIRLIVSHDETACSGSQMQPEAVTIEQKLTEAVQGLIRAPAQLILASCTDMGVHTLGNVAVFDTEFPMSAERFATMLNAYLPPDIRIQAADEAALNWHPRKRHCEKTYRYRIWNGRIMNPLLRNSVAHCYVPLNLAATHVTPPSLLGEHGFVAFCASGSAASHTMWRIFCAELMAEYEESGSFAGLITFCTTGSGFLYHMVWILAGTLLEIGSGKGDVVAFRKVLRSCARRDIGPVAPAAGLILRETRYLPTPDRYVADNEDWRYELPQEDLAPTEVSHLMVEHCRPDDCAGPMTRLLHESHQGGARCILLRDSEDSTHLTIGQRYGFYEVRENTNPENGNSFPYLVIEAESGAT